MSLLTLHIFKLTMIYLNVSFKIYISNMFKFLGLPEWRINKDLNSIQKNSQFIQNKGQISYQLFSFGKYHYFLKHKHLQHFFSWALPFFVKGFKKDLLEEDLYGPLKSHESKRLGDLLEAAWIKEESTRRKPSFWRPLIKVFGKEFWLYAIYVALVEFGTK